jgi:protein phosphatase
VGDSRAYLLRGGAARQLTKDQSLVQRLVDAGELTPEQAETSARRNIILQALGADRTVKVDVTHQPVRRGDLLLLCSDGLSGQLRAASWPRPPPRPADLDALCEALVDGPTRPAGPTTSRSSPPGSTAGAPAARRADADVVGHQQFAVLATPAATQGVVADLLAGAAPAGEHAEPPAPPATGAFANADAARPAGAPAAPPAGRALVDDDLADPGLAERRGRARLVYLALAIVAASVAAFYLWRLLLSA